MKRELYILSRATNNSSKSRSLATPGIYINIEATTAEDHII